MAELLFIATTVFVAYVLFTVIGGDNEKPEAQPAKTEPDNDEKTASQPEAISPPPAAPAAVSESVAKPVKKPSTGKTKTAPAAKAPAPKEPAAEAVEAKPASDSLKNPKTGEVAKVPGNYAFAKRWIKDALVEEGLLEKVYKNNELDNDTTAKIQAALAQLKTMEKYQ